VQGVACVGLNREGAKEASEQMRTWGGSGAGVGVGVRD